jgi:hypothetical protein
MSNDFALQVTTLPPMSKADFGSAAANGGIEPTFTDAAERMNVCYHGSANFLADAQTIWRLTKFRFEYP